MVKETVKNVKDKKIYELDRESKEYKEGMEKKTLRVLRYG